MPNRLAQETSPYLLQHAGNPVDWYPWGEEALNRARAENKPILLSIGYSACHWCHVMAHESFENDQIAALMNDNFVSIKVDREERPDLDTIYMEAVQTIAGTGGWPLTAFLTPEGKPFFGGTYFPPEDRHGMPGFPTVLRAVVEAYHTRQGELEQAIDQIIAAVAPPKTITSLQTPLTEDILNEAYLALKQSFDRNNGGFGAAPKFPQPMALEFLLRYSHRTGNTEAMGMVEMTIEKMAAGGIFDQVGGGFHRYSTDSYWLVPHFEKMLYDNAQLSQVYLHAYLANGKELYRSIAEETLDYVLREMTSPQGGFYSAQDADTEGVEGKYFLWTPQEIDETLGPEVGRTVNDYFGVTSEGNFEGANILHIAGGSGREKTTGMKQVKALLLKRREQRSKPGRDEKILASWNGLMLAVLAEAGCVLDRHDYLEAAINGATVLLDAMVVNGHLKHTYKDGKAKINGYLQDYAMVIDGLLMLHQATFGSRWLREAIRLADVMVEQFWDETAGDFYDTDPEQKDLFTRPRNHFDGVMPSGASAATFALLKLGKLTDNRMFEAIATRSLRAKQQAMSRNPLGFSHWLCALDFYLSWPKEIAIIGPERGPGNTGHASRDMRYMAAE